MRKVKSTHLLLEHQHSRSRDVHMRKNIQRALPSGRLITTIYQVVSKFSTNSRNNQNKLGKALRNLFREDMMSGEHIKGCFTPED